MWDLKTSWRKAGGNFTTLPETFRNNGYWTVGMGKGRGSAWIVYLPLPRWLQSSILGSKTMRHTRGRSLTSMPAMAASRATCLATALCRYNPLCKTVT